MVESESSTAAVTVEVVGENLLALLRNEPAPRGNQRPGVPPPLPKPESAENVKPRSAEGILQSGARPLFAPLKEEEPVRSQIPVFASPSSEDQSGELPSGTENAMGLVLYQSPAPNRRPVLLAFAGIALAAGGLTAYALRSVPASALTVISPAMESSLLSDVSPLRLTIESRDKAMIAIRWDPQSAPVGRATSGRLVILETGQPPRVVPLELSQLKVGHLFYETPADHVEFRLEVLDANGSLTKESLLAVAGPPEPPQQAETEHATNAVPAATPAHRPDSPVSQTIIKDVFGAAEKQLTPVLVKSSARSFSPPQNEREADALRAIYLEPPSDEVPSPSLAILAALPETFNHFAPPAASPPALKPTSVPASFRPANTGGAWTAATLLQRVPPVYPAAARTARVQGTVLFAVTITKEGRVKILQTISGNPLLVQPASDAVKQWVYRPTLMAGRPVDANTQVAVDFSLN